MLTAISIRNIVLIEKLDLSFDKGLIALTGETGAGKSILMDALALALGARGDATLVRRSQNQGQVTAVFELSPDHEVGEILGQSGITFDGPLILRRQQSADGRTKSFINDEPVSVQLLRRVSSLLVEIHGQHDDRALVETSRHRQMLDAFGGLQVEAESVSAAWDELQKAKADLEDHKERLKKRSEEAGFLAYAVEKLQALAPKQGEEEELASQRIVMMHAESISNDLSDALSALEGSRAAEADLNAILRKLERRSAEAGAILEPATAAIERVLVETNEAKEAIRAALHAAEFEPSVLERTEDRLFALRAAARKYKVGADELEDLCNRYQGELAAIDDSEETLKQLERAAEQSEENYRDAAVKLSEKREAIAEKLDLEVNGELAPLKLEKARFITHLETLPFDQANAQGIDRVTFWVQTNPGTNPGPMMKVASGGELSRLILALKVVLAAKGSAPVLIFDEIDTGVGGAVATAIGERLSRLAESLQVFTITHSPQVAALSNGHLHISKEAVKNKDGEEMITSVIALDEIHRREEIARMLAGTSVTDEARAAADRLMVGKK